MMLAFGSQIEEKATTCTSSKRAATMGFLLQRPQLLVLFFLTASCLLLLEKNTVDAFTTITTTLPLLPPQSSTATTTRGGGGYVVGVHQFSNVEGLLCSSSSSSRSRLYATIADETTDSSSSSSEEESPSSSSSNNMLEMIMLEQLKNVASNAKEYADMFGLSYSDAGFYAIFDAIRQSGISLGLKGQPFVLRNVDLCNSLQDIRMEELENENDDSENNSSPFAKFFTIDDLAKATEDDFLDAARGSTDNRKGWKVRLY